MANKELIPCPFCGSKRKIEVCEDEMFYVQCMKCGTRTDCYICETDAIEAWNDRQPDTELAALKGFAHAVISDCWNFTLDAGEIQDLAEQLGLIVPHTVTTDEADGDYGVGDTMYQFSDILKENK